MPKLMFRTIFKFTQIFHCSKKNENLSEGRKEFKIDLFMLAQDKTFMPSKLIIKIKRVYAVFFKPPQHFFLVVNLFGVSINLMKKK